MVLFGKDCGIVKTSGKMITKVLGPSGEPSRLYNDILNYIKELSPEDRDILKDKYKSWEEKGIVGDLDNSKHLGLAIFGQSTSKNFSELNLEKAEDGEYKFDDIKTHILTPAPKEDKLQQLLNKAETIPSKQSTVTQEAHTEFLKRNGFEVKTLFDGMTDSNGNKITPENSINFTEKLVNVIEGEEPTALGEESSHLAVRMISIKFPKLFQEMMNRIGNYKLYEDVINQYKDHKDYQIDGKPNIPKLKEETIGKVLNEYITKNSENETEKPELLKQVNSWWQRIKDNLKSLFNGNGYNPFKTAAKKFENKELDIENPIKDLTDKKEGEDYEHFKQRTLTEVQSIAKSVPDKTAIITHGSVLNLLKTNSEDAFNNTKSDNTEIFTKKVDGKDLFFIRHGESEDNAKNSKTASSENTNRLSRRDTQKSNDSENGDSRQLSDYSRDSKVSGGNSMERNSSSEKSTPLSDLGRRQSESLVQKLKQLGVTKIISTDTKRTKDTAKILQEGLGLEAKMHQLPSNWTPDQDNEGKKVFDRIREEKRIQKIIDEAKNINEYSGTTPEGKKFKPEFRASDVGKQIGEKKFGKKPTEQVEKNSRKEAVIGTRYHSYNENILDRFVDKETGLRRKKPIGPENFVSGEEEIYSKLEDYITSTLDKYPENTRFLWEQVVYKPGQKQKAGQDDFAGTIDFLAITPEAIGYSLDWKFKSDKGRTDTPDVSKQQHAAQLKIYANILKNSYGVKELKESIAIPILFKMDDKGLVTNLKIGDANYEKINSLDLLPIPSAETTLFKKDASGQEVVDKATTNLVQRFNGLLETLRSTPPKSDEWIKRKEDINRLDNAIRKLIFKKDVSGIINVSKTALDNSVKEILDIKKTLSDPDKKKNLTKEEINGIASSLLVAYSHADNFVGMESSLNHYLKGSMDADKYSYIINELKDISSKANNLKKGIYDPSTKEGLVADLGVSFADREGIFNYLSSEANIKYLVKQFNTLSSSRTKSTQLLAKVILPTWSKKDLMIADSVRELDKIRQSVTKWMGGNWTEEGKEKLKKLLYKYDKQGNWTPHLISKIDKEFYNKLSEHLDNYYKEGKRNESKEWIINNIDQEGYNKSYSQYLEQTKKVAENTIFDYENELNDKKLRDEFIDAYIARHDLALGTAYTSSNYLLKAHPKLEGDISWHSDKYKELLNPNNKEVLAYYNHKIKWNEEAKDLGILNTKFRFFSPQLRKDFIEGAMDGIGAKGMLRNFISKFILEPGDNGYRDPITGEPVKKIYAAHTYDLGEWKEDEKGKKYLDYTNVSDDLFKADTLFIGEVIKYKALSNLESLAKMMVMVEKNKKTLVVEKGKLVKEGGKNVETNKNEKNLEFLENMIDNIFYGKTHSGDDTGFSINIDGKEHFWSIPKTVDTLNRFYALKVLGLSPSTAFSNVFGGSVNSYITSNVHISKKDLTDGYKAIIDSKVFQTEKGDKFIHLLDHFVPFTEDINRELGRKMSHEELRKWLSGEGLMVLMRKSDNIVQMANSFAFFKNTMVENGKLVNIREYVRQKNNFDNIYNLPEGERNTLRNKVEKEIQDLQNNRNLFNDPNIKYKEGERVDFPGVKEYDASEIQLRQRILQLTRDCLGNRTPEEIAQINMTLFGSSLTMFKNWIPRLAQKRFGQFAYTPGAETYEEGRIHQVFTALQGNLEYKVKGLSSLIKYGIGIGGENELINIAKSDYQKKLSQEREKEGVFEGSMFEKTVSEGQYIDQYLRGVKAQVREVAATVALMAMFYAGLSWAASLNKDEYSWEQRGAAKYAVRMLDKFSDELAFFYSPVSAKKMIGNFSLPLGSVLIDLMRFSGNLTKEGYYDITGNEEAAKKNKVIKYPIDYMLGINQISDMFNYVSEDWHNTVGGSNISPRYNPFGY